MPSRLHAWLNCWRWKKSWRVPGSDVALDDQLYQEPQAAPVAVPMGKFAMYPDWQPDADFIRLAALWGVALREPVTTEELASFIAYWQAEGKVFHHVAVATKTGAQPANRSCQQRRTAETRCEYGQRT
ncbi:primosomal protein I [Escherichia coli]|uniref:Primosomal protein I n=1 Tax=Escherichia coli TaxID=562 RepID=A0A376LH49_ECOLX|nr:primosomal protein I [Escherichia coli]